MLIFNAYSAFNELLTEVYKFFEELGPLFTSLDSKLQFCMNMTEILNLSVC